MRRPDGVVTSSTTTAASAADTAPWPVLTQARVLNRDAPRPYHAPHDFTPFEKIGYFQRLGAVEHGKGVIEKCTFCLHRLEQGGSRPASTPARRVRGSSETWTIPRARWRNWRRKPPAGWRSRDEAEGLVPAPCRAIGALGRARRHEVGDRRPWLRGQNVARNAGDEGYPPWRPDSAVKGSFGVGGSWMVSMEGTKPVQIELAHTHDCDETLGFAGSNMANVDELGGEIELWLEDEQLIITRSCLVFIPKGMKHCPMFVRRVERPSSSLVLRLATTTRGHGRRITGNTCSPHVVS